MKTNNDKIRIKNILGSQYASKVLKNINYSDKKATSRLIYRVVNGEVDDRNIKLAVWETVEEQIQIDNKIESIKSKI